MSVNSRLKDLKNCSLVFLVSAVGMFVTWEYKFHIFYEIFVLILINNFFLRHNNPIQCVQYNPISHQLASCSVDDFGK